LKAHLYNGEPPMLNILAYAGPHLFQPTT